MLTFCKILLNAKFSFMNYTSNCVAFHFTIQSRNSCGLRCISTTTISLNSRKPGIVRHKILDRDFVQALKGVVNNPKSIRDGLSALAVETKKYFEEKREKMDNFNRIFEPRRPDGNIDILFKFEKNEDLDNFFVTTDSANEGGYSSASLKITPDKTAMFSGFLSTTPPKDGKTKYAGYANMSCKRKMVNAVPL